MVDAKMVRDIATKYIYDRCPAVVGVGKKNSPPILQIVANALGDWYESVTFEIKFYNTASASFRGYLLKSPRQK